MISTKLSSQQLKCRAHGAHARACLHDQGSAVVLGASFVQLSARKCRQLFTPHPGGVAQCATCSPRALQTLSSLRRVYRQLRLHVSQSLRGARVYVCMYGTRASMRVQRRNTHAALSSATPIGTRDGTSTDVVHAGIPLATQTTRLDPNVCERACAASALCSQVCSTLGLPRQCVGFFFIYLSCAACLPGRA